MKVAIYLWSFNHYLWKDVFYNLDDAIKSCNEVTGCNFKKEELTNTDDLKGEDAVDALPQRYIPKQTGENNYQRIRFFRRVVDLPQAKEDVLN